jgi:polyisoprenoid-binding protein YceI
MGTWLFEPGHTAAMFRARHMMVTYGRGHFKNVSGSLVFDPENPAQSSADVAIDAAAIWTGQPQRDAHLRSADFLDVENHPRITFKGNQVEVSANPAVIRQWRAHLHRARASGGGAVGSGLGCVNK